MHEIKKRKAVIFIDVQKIQKRSNFNNSGDQRMTEVDGEGVHEAAVGEK